MFKANLKTRIMALMVSCVGSAVVCAVMMFIVKLLNEALADKVVISLKVPLIWAWLLMVVFVMLIFEIGIIINSIRVKISIRKARKNIPKGKKIIYESIASYRREEKISLGLIVLTEDELGYYPIDFMNKSMKSYKSLRECFMEDTQGVVISLRNIVEVKRGEKAKTFVVKTGTEEYSFGVVKNNSKKIIKEINKRI